jgi:hypothetical protein
MPTQASIQHQGRINANAQELKTQDLNRRIRMSRGDSGSVEFIADSLNTIRAPHTPFGDAYWRQEKRQQCFVLNLSSDREVNHNNGKSESPRYDDLEQAMNLQTQN